MKKRMKESRKRKERKEPGLLRKVVSILYEDVKRRRAIRVLERQAWGLDFLSLALVKAGRHLGEGITLSITNRDGTRLEISYDDARRNDAVQKLDDSVFMHLDDDLAVDRFIRENSRR